MKKKFETVSEYFYNNSGDKLFKSTKEIVKSMDKQFININDEDKLKKKGYIKIDKIREMTWDEVIELIHD